MTRITAMLLLGAILGPCPSGADEEAPPRPGLARRAIDSFLGDDETGRGFHLGPFAPRLAIVSSGAGPAPVLHFWMPGLGGTPLDIHAAVAYSIHGYRYAGLRVGLVPHEGEGMPPTENGTRALFPLADLERTSQIQGFSAYASARYRDFPQEIFYGVGPDSVQSARTGYRLQDGLYEGIVRYGWARLSIMGRAGWLRSSILPGTGDAFPDIALGNDDATAPGLLNLPDFLVTAGGIWLELRDEPGNPHRGFSLGVAVARFDDHPGTAFQFTRATLDTREYVSLGSPRHVVALWQVASLDSPDAGSRVPFSMQPTLGGGSLLGGYSAFRFRGDKLLALSAEYRFEVHPKVELALIAEAGKVFSDIGQLDLGGLRQSWGGGLRLKSRRNVRLRVDVLHSVERTRVQIRLGPSF